MQEIMKFEGNDVEVIQNENGEPLFEIYSTGKALGYARSNSKSAGEHDVYPKLFPYKSRIDTTIIAVSHYKIPLLYKQGDFYCVICITGKLYYT